MFNKPILLIIFNRPDTASEVFKVIKNVKPRKLYLAADGPRKNVAGEDLKCKEAREIINKIDWECEVKTRFLNENLGCDVAVPAAISWFFENEEDGIIFEDDCVPDESFFNFCSLLLDKYKNNDNVMMISGNNFQNTNFHLSNNESYYFSKYATIWGWATWKRAWNKFEDDFKKFDNELMFNRISRSFLTKQEKKYWKGFYKKIRRGKFGFWDSKWLLSIVYDKGCSIIPIVNLVQNIGFGKDATHTGDAPEMSVKSNELKFINYPDNIKINFIADKVVFNKNYKIRLKTRFRQVIKIIEKIIKNEK